MINRIIEARLEITALANGLLAAAIAFGANLTDEQQVAVVAVVNGVGLVAYRIVKGKPAPK